MSEPVTATAQSLYQDLKENAPHLRAAVAAAREAAIEYLSAKRAHERQYDRALLKAQGSSVAEREARARIATEELRAVLDDALERKRFTKLDVDAWEHILRAYGDVAQLAKQEVRSLS